MAIYKLRKNKKLTKEGVEYLENIMFNKLGSQSDYEEAFENIPVSKLVRSLVGIDANTAME